MAYFGNISCVNYEEDLCGQLQNLFYSVDVIYDAMEGLVGVVLNHQRHWCDSKIFEATLLPVVDGLESCEMMVGLLEGFVKPLVADEVANCISSLPTDHRLSILSVYFQLELYLPSDSSKDGSTEEDGEDSDNDRHNRAMERYLEKATECERMRIFSENAWEVFRCDRQEVEESSSSSESSEEEKPYASGKNFLFFIFTKAMISSDSSSSAEESSGKSGQGFQARLSRSSLFRGSPSSHSSSSSESSDEPSIPSGTQHRNPPPSQNNFLTSTSPKPSSLKRHRERESKTESSKLLHKKSKKTGKLEEEEKAASEEEDLQDTEEAATDSHATGKLEQNEIDTPEVKTSKSENNRKGNTLALVDKSGKEKFAWNGKDEIALLSGLAECTEKGKKLSKNALFNYVKSQLDSEYSDKQLDNKLKRLKMKFKDSIEKIKEPGIRFKSPHEERVFKLSKKIWGKEEEEETVTKKNKDKERNKKLATKPDDEEEEEEVEEKDDDGIEPNMQGKELGINKGDQNRGKDSAARFSNGVQEDLLLCGSKGELSRGDVKVSGTWLLDLMNQVVKENMDTVKEFNMEMFKEIMKTMSKHNQNMLNRMLETNQRCSSNKGAKSNFLFSTNEMIERFPSSSFMELPALSDSEEKEFKRKWQEQEAVEMEANIKRLVLLQEELQMRMTKLRASGNNISS
ncbi:uncharacterized protein LOC131074842 [Cryptomeria japonica]|uniref:uncharacterized protein LOC131074842 n=1 Tax=Cryptomeria japonica TaxID=3369 RepID=UPI0027DA56C0|nr:uncharacterized protein LOC131074842 [Cryptomeria japonica]